jgi:hypothetical protein
MSRRFSIALWALMAAAGTVMAQPSSTGPAAGHNAALPPTAAAAASASASSDPLSHRSVFKAYRSFQDQPVVSWREANDLVGRIGGWQSYAREGAGQSGVPAKTAPAPAKPPASASGAHSEHNRP